MSRREFLSWWEFHKRNPLDPVSLQANPAALVAYTIAAHSPGGTRRTLADFRHDLVPVLEEEDRKSVV